MFIPSNKKPEILIVCIEHDHGRKGKRGDLKLVWNPDNYIYTSKNFWKKIPDGAKWRLAVPFEQDIYYNGIENIRIFNI